MLPPNTFRAGSTDLLLSATPTAGGIFVQPAQSAQQEIVAWAAPTPGQDQDVCPYATFQVSWTGLGQEVQVLTESWIDYAVPLHICIHRVGISYIFSVYVYV